MGFPRGSVVKNPPANAGYVGSTPGSEKIPRGRKWQPTPEKSHGQWSLAGYSPWGGKRVERDVVTKHQNLVNKVLLREGMAPHSSILDWRIPWTEKPGGPQPIGLQSWT